MEAAGDVLAARVLHDELDLEGEARLIAAPLAKVVPKVCPRFFVQPFNGVAFTTTWHFDIEDCAWGQQDGLDVVAHDELRLLCELRFEGGWLPEGARSDQPRVVGDHVARHRGTCDIVVARTQPEAGAHFGERRIKRERLDGFVALRSRIGHQRFQPVDSQALCARANLAVLIQRRARPVVVPWSLAQHHIEWLLRSLATGL